MKKFAYSTVVGLALLWLMWVGSAAQAEQEVEVPESGSVTVVKQGEGERTLLRYRFAKGASVHTRSSMKMAMEIKIDGMSDGPVEMPTMVIDEVSRIVDVLDDGTAKVESEITRVVVRNDGKLPAEVRAEHRRAMLTMVGFKVSSRIDPQGKMAVVVAKAPEGLDPAIADQMEQIRQLMEAGTIMFPKEPVAVGSTWVEVIPVSANGLKVRQETRYTLRAITDAGLVLDVAIRQEAPRQTIKIMGMEITYTKLETQGAGSSRVDLANHQGSGKMDSATRVEYEFDVDGDRVRCEMAMTMAISIAPATDQE